jgi:hypothetical protein
VKLNDVKEIVMDRVCIYDTKNLENIWTGDIRNMPSKYLNLEIKVIGAKRKGIVDIGIIPFSEEK